MTVADKLKVIEMGSRAISQRKIASQLNVSKTQVQAILNRKESIQESVNSGNQRLDARWIGDFSKYPEIDAAVYKWFVSVRKPEHRCKPLPVSRSLLQARALQEAKLRNITDFKASDGWFLGWRRRHQIGASICLNGEAGDVDVNELEPLMQNFRKSLIDYRPENIFNMDESGLFFRALPARTYLVNSEKRRDVRGIKALTAKDRVTIIFCVNATGTRKVPPLIVGSSKTPHCFQDSRPPLPYINQANSWLNSAVYRH